MKKELTKRQKAIRKRRIFLSVCALCLAVCIGLLAFIIGTVSKAFKSDANKGNESDIVSSETQKEPYVLSSATVINTGDILIHNPVLAGAQRGDGSYDFSGLYTEVKKYFDRADLAVANLEVTLGGTQSGSYKGYPAFNIPDSIIDAVRNEGIDMLLTANNHSYDTGLYGFKRTVQVLKEKKIAYTGTRETTEEPRYLIKNVNGIKIGMINYTYENSSSAQGRKSLNGNIIAAEANDLINSFNYNNIDAFYTDAENMISAMKANGADCVVFYMHWGEEYQLKENTWQRAIAQRLCNLGVDVIVGGHPHVIQPIDLLYAEGGEHTTVCLYSMGNSISNQRLLELSNLSPNGHTEDGLLFSYTFDKYSDGTVLLSAVDIVPCWVSKTGSRYNATYKLHPLENENSHKDLNFPDSTLSDSYLRTKETVAAGLTECQQYLGCEIRFK